MSEIQNYLTYDLINKGLSSNSILSENFGSLSSILENDKFSSNSNYFSIKIDHLIDRKLYFEYFFYIDQNLLIREKQA